jgi:hypothetical protein
MITVVIVTAVPLNPRKRIAEVMIVALVKMT